MMRKIRQQLMMVTATAVMAATLSVCRSENSVPSFRNVTEALRACRIEMKRISSKDGATLDEVARMCNRWLQMQDSCEAVFGRDTTLDFSGETARHFIDVSDSIRKGIMTLALKRDHKTEEVMNLKLGTAPQRKVLQESQAYIDAARFIEGLNHNTLCKNLNETDGRFDNLMRKEIRTDSKGLLEFLTEDIRIMRTSGNARKLYTVMLLIVMLVYTYVDYAALEQAAKVVKAAMEAPVTDTSVSIIEAYAPMIPDKYVLFACQLLTFAFFFLQIF